MPPFDPGATEYEKRIAGKTAGVTITPFKLQGSSTKYVLVKKGNKYSLEEWSPNGSRMSTSTSITADYAKQLILDSLPKKVDVPLGGSDIQELRKVLNNLQNIKPNSNGQYLVGGKLLTKIGWQDAINKTQSNIDKISGMTTATPEQIAVSSEANRAAYKQRADELATKLGDVQYQIKVLEDKSKKAKTVEEQTNLNSWISFYESKVAPIQNVIDALNSGQDVAVEPEFPTIVSVADASKSPNTEMTAPAATTLGVGGAFAPLTPPRSGRPAGAAAQEGPLVSETGDFSRLIPGSNIGGADRKLPNGGAVVNGIYIPPGLNFGGTQTKPGTTTTTTTTGGGGGGGTGGTGGMGGAGGIGGIGGTIGGTPDGTTAPAVPTDWEQAAQEQYGGYYAIVKSIPEVSALLQNAVANDWSNDKFNYELSQTTWFKTTSTSARQWDLSEQSDPASAQQKVDNQAAQIKAKALTLGIRLDDTSVAKLAKDSLRGGWDETTITNSIGSQAMQSTAGVSQLRSGYIGQTLRQTAADYGISLSDDTFNQFVNKVATGQESQNSFQQYALQMAKSLFPGIAAQLDAGQTYKQIVDPYKQTAAQILEMNPESIDFVDPKWSKAVTFVTDKGEQRPMNYNEWGDYLRQTRSFGYEFTSEAQSRAYGVANDLARLFGKA